MNGVYTFGYDRETLCYVGVLSGRSSTDEDYEKLVQSTDELTVDAKAQQRASSWIFVVDPSHARPNDAQRRRLAAARGADLGNLAMHMAVVTDSALVRSAVNAINWLSAPAPGVVLHAVRSFDHAMLWCEEQRGELLPALRRLHAEARAAA